MSGAARLPIVNSTFDCSTVKRLAQLTTESTGSADFFPSGVPTSMSKCVAVAERRVVLVIIATIAFVRRKLSVSFCTTSAGRRLPPPPPENGQSSRTISPRLTLIVLALGNGRTPPFLGRSNPPSQRRCPSTGKRRVRRNPPRPRRSEADRRPQRLQLQ